jgi:HEAT repeat protein
VIAAALPDGASLLRRALRDPDPIASGTAGEVLCRSLDGDALRKVLAVMQRGTTRTRCLALETLAARFPRDAEPALRAALLDPATAVRELARFRWGKLDLPPLAFATFYREQLAVQRGERFATALRGLAETGTANDVPVFVQHLDHPRARVREAAVLGLGRCDGQNQVERLVKALEDSNHRVTKAAHRYAKLYLGRGAVPRRPPRGKG